MASTVNSYSVSLAMDASSYINSSKLTRKETQQLSRVINSSRGPMDKYERAINAIDNALKKEAIRTEVANRLKAEAAAKYGIVAKQATVAARAIDTVNVKMTGIGKTFIATAAAMFSVRGIINGFRQLADQMERVDVAAKAARGLSITFNELRGIQLAGTQVAGANPEMMTSLLGRLQRRIGDAATTSKQLAKVFREDLGLALDELTQMNLVEQFEAVRSAIAGIENPTLQTSVALKIFDAEGKKILPLLQATNLETADYIAKFTRMAGVTDSQIGRMELVNDLLTEQTLAWEALNNAIAGADVVSGTFIVTLNHLNNELGKIAFVLRAIASFTENQERRQYQEIIARWRTMDFLKQHFGLTTEEAKALLSTPASALKPSQAAAGAGGAGGKQANPLAPFQAGMFNNRFNIANIGMAIGQGIARASGAAARGVVGAANTGIDALNPGPDESIRWTRQGGGSVVQQGTSEFVDLMNEQSEWDAIARREELRAQKKAEKQREENNKLQTKILETMRNMGWGAV